MASPELTQTKPVTLSTEYGPEAATEPVGDDVWLNTSTSYRQFNQPSAAAAAKRLSRTADGREHLWSRALLHFRHIILPMLLALLVVAIILIWKWLDTETVQLAPVDRDQTVLSTSVPSSSLDAPAATGPIFAEPSYTERTRTESTVAEPRVTEPRANEPRRAAPAPTSTTSPTTTVPSTSVPSSSVPSSSVPSSSVPSTVEPEPDCEPESPDKPGKRKGQIKKRC